MQNILPIVQVVLGLIPQLSAFEGEAEVGYAAAKQLYQKLQGLFGSDVLPDKTDEEVAELASKGWDELLAHVASERARVQAELAAAPAPPEA